MSKKSSNFFVPIFRRRISTTTYYDSEHKMTIANAIPIDVYEITSWNRRRVARKVETLRYASAAKKD